MRPLQRIFQPRRGSTRPPRFYDPLKAPHNPAPVSELLPGVVAMPAAIWEQRKKMKSLAQNAQEREFALKRPGLQPYFKTWAFSRDDYKAWDKKPSATAKENTPAAKPAGKGAAKGAVAGGPSIAIAARSATRNLKSVFLADDDIYVEVPRPNFGMEVKKDDSDFWNHRNAQLSNAQPR